MLTPSDSKTPQIIAFGGCGVADRWVDPTPFRYVLEATRTARLAPSRPRVGLVGAACGDDHRVLSRLHRIYRRLGASTRHLRIDGARSRHLDALSANYDVIHVEGGNLAFLMERLRRSAMDLALKRAWEDGVVLTGTSAGAGCWFEHAIGASMFSFLETDEAMEVQLGLGLLGGSLCVHYDVAPRRGDVYRAQVRAGLAPGYGLAHDAGLHFRGRDLTRVICRTTGAGVTSVRLGSSGLEQEHVAGNPLEPLTLSESLARRMTNIGASLRYRVSQRLRFKDSAVNLEPS